MKCRRIYKDLPAFYNNELDETHSQKIKIHLEACPRCRKEYETLTYTVNVIKNVDDIKLSPDFNKRLGEKIMAFEKRRIKKKRMRLSLRSLWEYFLFSQERLWPKAAAGILAVLFIGLIQSSWTIVNLDYQLTSWPAIKNFGLREINLSYNFFEIGMENKEDYISLKMRIGS